MSDLNYVEDSAGGPDVTVGILAKMDKVTLLQVKRSRFLIIQNSSIAQACLYMQQWLHISTFFCTILFLYCDCLLHSVIFSIRKQLKFFFSDGCKITDGHIWKRNGTCHRRVQSNCDIHPRGTHLFALLLLSIAVDLGCLSFTFDLSPVIDTLELLNAPWLPNCDIHVDLWPSRHYTETGAIGEHKAAGVSAWLILKVKRWIPSTQLV